jgi:hypothetical protein
MVVIFGRVSLRIAAFHFGLFGFMVVLVVSHECLLSA